MNILTKDTLREIIKTKTKFISIMIIMLLGVFVFVGLEETPKAIKNTANTYLNSIDMYDLKVTNAFGITEEDVNVVKSLNNIKYAETYYSKKIKVDKINDEINLISLPQKIALTKQIEGRLPKEENEIVITEALKNQYSLGETILIKEQYRQEANQIELKNKEYKIVGFVYGADFPDNSSNNKVSKNYFAYVSKENFISNKYSGINILLTDFDTRDFSDDSYYKKLSLYREDLAEKLKKQQEEHNKNFKETANANLEENKSKIELLKTRLNESKKNLESIKYILPEKYEKESKEIKEKEKTLQEQEEKLQISEKKINNKNYPRFRIESVKENATYAKFINSADSLKDIANIFSIFLYAVAILVTLTTITRMIEENRINIGTLKSLGYSDIEISKKYYVYGITSSLVGGMLGIILAYNILVPAVYNSYAKSLVMKIPIIQKDINIIIISLLISVICVVLSVHIPLRRLLKENTSSLLRPKVPERAKRIFLEKISFIWKRLNFLRKVTFRNIFCYKIRMLMTIFGVLGCLSLMFVGFGIRNSIENLEPEQFDKITKYDILAVYNPYISDFEKKGIKKTINQNTDVEKSQEISVGQATIESDNRVVDKITMFILEKDEKDFFNLKKGIKKLSLDDNGVIIDEKLAHLYKLKVGDNLKIFFDDNEYTVKISAINENYIEHNMYLKKEYFEKTFAENYEKNAYLIKTNHDKDKTENIVESLDENENISFVKNNMAIRKIIEDQVEAVDILVIVIVLCSTSLALVVLYNLINVNVSERIRELSTIKVLGFYSKEVTLYVFREIFYLTLIGIIIGNFVGVLLYRKIILDLAGRNMMFDSKPSYLTYIISTALTLIIVICVMILMHFRLKKVNMVEALKGVE